MRGKQYRNRVQKQKHFLQFHLARSRNILVPKQHLQGGFQDLVIQVVLRKLVKGTGDLGLVLDAGLNGLRKIQLSPQNRPGLTSGNIFPIKSLLQLPGNALCKDGSKQIVDVLKLFRGNALIILLLQHLIGVGEHIVDVLDKNPFVSRH